MKQLTEKLQVYLTLLVVHALMEDVDMISLMSSFSARIYGRRSAENQRKKKEAKNASQAGV